MDHVFPPCDRALDDSWLAPLQGVERALQGDPRYTFFDATDFMVMCRLIRRRRPSIVLYKHYYTRHYLNLDDAGHAYRYVPPRGESKHMGRYVALRDLSAAVDALELWELPWMKPGLEAHQRGLAWDERWRLHPDVADDDDAWGGGRHGGLRLV